MARNLVCKQPGCHKPAYEYGRCTGHYKAKDIEAELKTVRSRCRTALVHVRNQVDFATHDHPWNAPPAEDFDFHKLEKTLVKALRILDDYDEQVK